MSRSTLLFVLFREIAKEFPNELCRTKKVQRWYCFSAPTFIWMGLLKHYGLLIKYWKSYRIKFPCISLLSESDFFVMPAQRQGVSTGKYPLSTYNFLLLKHEPKRGGKRSRFIFYICVGKKVCPTQSALHLNSTRSTSYLWFTTICLSSRRHQASFCWTCTFIPAGRCLRESGRNKSLNVVLFYWSLKKTSQNL